VYYVTNYTFLSSGRGEPRNSWTAHSQNCFKLM